MDDAGYGDGFDWFCDDDFWAGWYPAGPAALMTAPVVVTALASVIVVWILMVAVGRERNLQRTIDRQAHNFGLACQQIEALEAELEAVHRLIREDKIAVVMGECKDVVDYPPIYVYWN